MSLSLTTDPGESLSFFTDPGESLSFFTDPGEFHTNWEERLWSGNRPEMYSINGLDDVLVGSWTSMEEPEWNHDNPILRLDPFTTNLSEIADVAETTYPTETESDPSEPARKRKVGRPRKTEMRTVTALPTGRVSDQALMEARYRRKRDLNNIASSKCRLNR